MFCVDLYFGEWKDLRVSVVVFREIIHAKSPVIIRPVLEVVHFRHIHCMWSNAFYSDTTVNFLNIRTPQKLVVITLLFELCGSIIE